MAFTLFYAWQGDVSEKENRYLILEAAKEAVKQVPDGGEVNEAPRVDHDTKGIAGIPEIAASIFAKIDTAGMFLADVTFTGKAKTHDGRKKKLPNVNAAIELGYAAKALGWERIILVMNTAYGKPDEQVFDIKHRRNPFTYNLPADSDAPTRKSALEKLTKSFVMAIKSANTCQHEEAARVASFLDEYCLRVMLLKAKEPFFPSPVIDSAKGAAVALPLTQTLARMLELRIIRCHAQFDVETQSWMYAYHWTYLGRLVLKHLKIID